jgi:hypothetical protein
VQHDNALYLTKDHVVDLLKRDKNGEEAHAIEKSHLDPATRQLLSVKMARRMELWQRQLPVREFRGY